MKDKFTAMQGKIYQSFNLTEEKYEIQLLSCFGVKLAFHGCTGTHFRIY